MLLASAGGNRVAVIAQLVQADVDTVRDVIHRFNEIGLAALDPRWAGGRPRRLSPDDDFVVATAVTRPTKLGQPFTRWSIRKLAAYLRKVHGRVIRIGREASRCLLARRGVTFQRTKTWNESPGSRPGCQARPHRGSPGAVPRPGVRVRRVRAARHPPHGRVVLGPCRLPRAASRDVPPHPRGAVLPQLLLDRRRHLIGCQPT